MARPVRVAPSSCPRPFLPTGQAPGPAERTGAGGWSVNSRGRAGSTQPHGTREVPDAPPAARFIIGMRTPTSSSRFLTRLIAGLAAASMATLTAGVLGTTAAHAAPAEGAIVAANAAGAIKDRYI